MCTAIGYRYAGRTRILPQLYACTHDAQRTESFFSSSPPCQQDEKTALPCGNRTRAPFEVRRILQKCHDVYHRTTMHIATVVLGP